MRKAEIARRQLDGAIRSRLKREDPIIAATLQFPASQILRDLNINNPSAVSSAMTSLVEELGGNSGHMWKEFNQTSGANDFKHARSEESSRQATKALAELDEAIIFSIQEHMAGNKGSVSPYMAAFVAYHARQKDRSARNAIAARLRNALDRFISLRSVDLRVAFWGACVKILEGLRAHLQR
ncbi:MAG TPA: hypothetical protein VGO52_05700 [Hyphomonadaceae bacterium]|jgi:hypothetical protein|nr:hypothetical protein [Hyphomonadaceae bacterium]